MWRLQNRSARQRRVTGGRIGLLAVALAATAFPALTLALPASAGVVTGFSISMPTPASVGQTNLAASITVTDLDSAPQNTGTLTLNTLNFVPSCGSAASTITGNCPVASADPGVYSVSATGTGAAGSACAGTTFTNSVIDASTGQETFTPNTAVVLGPPTSATQSCTVDFTVSVLKAPAHPVSVAGANSFVTEQLAYASSKASEDSSTAADSFNATSTVNVPAGPSCTRNGNIEVTDTDNNTVLGDVSKDWNTFGEYVVTTTPSDYLSATVVTGSEVNVVGLNEPDASFPDVGAIQGFFTSNPNLGIGSANYAYLGGTTSTSPGALPSNQANAFTSATSIAEDQESAIWSLGTNDGLTPQWVNTDASLPATHLVDFTGILAVTGDTSAFQSTFGSASDVSLTFQSTTGQCGQTVAFTSTPNSPTYGGTYTPTAAASSGLAPTFALDSGSGTGVCTVSGSTVTFTKVGTCKVDADQTGDGAFSAATPAVQTIVVGPASLTVTGPSPTVGVGSPIPTLTPIYGTFANGDTKANLTTQAACATMATSASPAGSYPVTCSGAADSNYTFNYVNGSLTIVAVVSPTNANLSATGCQSYSVTFSAGSGYTYHVTSGSVPPGMNFNASTGVLSGTSSVASSYPFTVSATQSGFPTVQRSYVLTVGLCVGPTSGVLPAGVHKEAYSYTLTTTGGTAPYRYQIQSGALPTGLSLSSAGLISGTTGVTGTFSVTILALDSANPVHQGAHTFTITIS